MKPIHSVVMLIAVLLVGGCSEQTTLPSADAPAAVDVHGLNAHSQDRPIAKMPSQPGGKGLSGMVDGGNQTASCAEEYSTQTLTDRAYALDGTVVAISAPPARVGNPSGYAQVTLNVNQWFKGGVGETIDLLMVPPADGPSVEERPTYALGTRLLVSGEFLRNGQPVAWGCGFLRYHSEAEAMAWSTTFK